MKKMTAAVMLCLFICVLLVGCANSAPRQDAGAQMVGLGNPWSTWASIQEAESAVGFSFGLSEVIAERYTAYQFRTMNDTLMEITYRDGEFEVCIRKQEGEGQDVSGDYTEYKNSHEITDRGGAITVFQNPDQDGVKYLISYQGYSWSMVASKGIPGDADEDFLKEILNGK